MAKKKNSPTNNLEERIVPLIKDDSSSLGDIKINFSVIASIVKLATLEIPGVVSLSSGFVNEITGIFKKKDSETGIRVDEDESGNYIIKIRVILSLGVRIAKIAYEIQKTIGDRVRKMTSKRVAKVDVFIEGVKISKIAPKVEDKDLSELEYTD
tara:strand:- start:19 stop:480 length:462 start_codon:yes stop_codon:yes gene_type:complete